MLRPYREGHAQCNPALFVLAFFVVVGLLGYHYRAVVASYVITTLLAIAAALASAALVLAVREIRMWHRVPAPAPVEEPQHVDAVTPVPSSMVSGQGKSVVAVSSGPGKEAEDVLSAAERVVSEALGKIQAEEA